MGKFQIEENRIKTDKQQVQFGIYISKIISLAKSDDHTFSDAYQYAMKPENNKYFSIFVDKLVIFLILMVAFSVCVYKGWKMANNSFMPRNYPY